MLPTLLTLGNAVSGFGAITFAVGWPGYDPATCRLTAGLLIFLAMLFDGMDGAAARWAKQESEFGARLDSLCDAISFGAAPAVLMLVLSQPLGYHPRVLWVVGALYVTCAVLRLARFGVEAGDNHEPGVFWGLPSPAAAAVVASFPIMLYGPELLAAGAPDGVGRGLESLVTQALPLVTFAVAGLMVSRVRYRHLLVRLLRGRRRGPHVVRMVFTAAVIAAVPRVTVPLLAFWYAFVPPAVALWNQRRAPAPPPPAEPPAAPPPA